MLSALARKALETTLRRGKTRTAAVDGPDGVASLEQLPLNGWPQWVLIRGRDVRKPLLIFLHGGPGSAAMWFAHHWMGELERHFVCVNWDQRGAGRSYRPRPAAETMRLAQFVADTVALIEHLTARMGQDKVFLLGQSWGSVLAMKVAAARPDLLHAVVGVGQVVDMMQGEQISYAYALDRARRTDNKRAVRALERIGGPPYRGTDLFTQRRWLSEFKGDTWSLSLAEVLSIGLRASEYSLGDFGRFLRGAKWSNRLLWDELMTVSLTREVPAVAVPVAFLAGRHDYTTPFELVEAYLESLRAPWKRLVWFDNSAHMPNLEEPTKFQAEMVAIGQEVQQLAVPHLSSRGCGRHN